MSENTNTHLHSSRSVTRVRPIKLLLSACPRAVPASNTWSVSGRLLIALAAMFLATLLSQYPGHRAFAATTVSSCDEQSFRAAVASATAGDTITFSCSGTVTLTGAGGGAVILDKNLTIDGSGQSVTISGGGSVGVFEVNAGVNATLSHVTIADGADGGLALMAGGAGTYGGVLNLGSLTIIHSAVVGNSALDGAGGIRNYGELNISGSTIANNSGLVAGIHQIAGTLNITDSTVRDNIGATTTTYSTAGAIVLSNGTATVTRTTLAGNVGDLAGGISMNTFTTLSVVNSTLSGNAALVPDSAGAILNDQGTLTVTNSTIVDNVAPNVSGGTAGWNNAGGIQSVFGLSTTLTNTVLARNVGQAGGNCFLGVQPDAGGNLSDDNSCGFTDSTSENQVTQLNLGTLNANGGPTQTVSLGVGSVAIDHGSCLVAVDQRGFPRPGNGGTACDSGAFEVQGSGLNLVNMPADIVLSTDQAGSPSATSAIVTYTLPMATDSAGNPLAATVSCDPPPGATFPLGTTTVTCTATDPGATPTTVSDTFTVTIVQRWATVVEGLGRYDGSATLTATLSGYLEGVPAPEPGVVVSFNLNGSYVGSGVTMSDGVATLSGVPMTGLEAGLHAGVVSATFNLSIVDLIGNGDLLVERADQDINVTTPAPPSAQDGSSFTVAATASSGLQVVYSASGSCTSSGPIVTMTGGSGICSVTYSQQGDANFNAATPLSQTVIGVITPDDQTAPTIVASATTAPNGNDWYSTDVTVHFTCSDADSGIPDGACPADLVLTGEGTGISSPPLTVTDAAGNTSAPSNIVAVDIDRTAPTVTGFASPSANGAGWNNTTVTVSYACADALSGVASVTPDDVLSEEGANESASGVCTDLAGNMAGAQVNGINIDRTAPTLSASASPSANGAGWNNTTVTVSYACADALSGVASVTPDDVLSEEGANQSASGVCTDLAGNTAGAQVDGINIDRTAPTLSASASPTANAAGWNRTVVAVSYACADALSGVASVTPDAVLSEEGANQSASGACTDLAGNTAITTAHGINIDLTEPYASTSQLPGSSQTGWNNTAVTVSFTCTDALSGIVDPYPEPMVLDGDGAGQLASGTCYDRAGNSAVASRVVNIDKTAPLVTISSPTDLSVKPIGVSLSFGADDALSGLAAISATLSNGSTDSTALAANGQGVDIPGVYTLTVIGSDRAGNEATRTVTFVVYDPSEGFVTGGGWIMSPTGACRLLSICEAATGKATFGFVSRYKKGATIPTGTTQFEFRNGDLSFESTAYEWLVVGGAKAQYKGVGTINGGGSYGFMLTAVDGGLDGDTFRVKIWDMATGDTVYDNRIGDDDGSAPTEVLGGGSSSFTSEDCQVEGIGQAVAIGQSLHGGCIWRRAQ